MSLLFVLTTPGRQQKSVSLPCSSREGEKAVTICTCHPIQKTGKYNHL